MARCGLVLLLWLAVHVACWPHVISSEQDAASFHEEVLGLGPDASQMDAQLAYVNLTNGHEPAGATEEDRRRFVQIQLAFDKFSDAEIREETVGMVRYWDYVKELEDDDELRYFAEFRAGGSAQLRIIFLLNAPQLRSWSIFEAAAKLHGRAQVAQLYAETPSQGPFLSSLRVKQLPAAVLFDALSRSTRVTYSLEGVHSAVERLLQGQQSSADFLARVIELNAENYQTRCGGGSPCNWMVIWATTAAFEARSDFGQAARPLVESCKRLHGSSARLALRVACFWLRLDHAPAWKALLQDNGLKDSDELTTVVMRTEPLGLSIAPPSVDPQSTEKLHRWMEEQVANAPPSQAYLQGGLPSLPDPVGIDEDPHAKPPASFSSRAVKLVGNLAPQLSKWWQQVQVMDREDQSILAGIVLLVLLLLGFLGSKLCSCCSRRAAGSSASEAKVLEALVPVTCVRLSRQGEKLGINIAPAAHDRFSISGIDERGLVSRWNESQPPDLRVQQGDFIVWAASAAAGTTVSSQAGMSALFKGADDLVLGVASLRQGGSSQQRIHGTVELNGLVLRDMAVLVSPRSSHAPGFDQAGLEVAQVTPRLAEWNDAQRSKGACCMQRVEVGDRIVSINGSTDVAGLAGAASPQVMLVRWGPPGSFRLERVEVSLQRSSPQDRLGLQIRQSPSAKDEIEVLDVVPEGAVARSNMAGGNRVLNGDRIVAVNGLREQKAMMEALGGLRTTLTLERWLQEGNGFAGGQAPAASMAVAAAAAPAAAPSLPSDGQVGSSSSGAERELSFLPDASHMLMLAVIGVVVAIGVGILPSPTAEVLREARQAASAPLQPQPMPESSRSFMAQVHPELYMDVAAPLLLLGGLLACRFLLSELQTLGRPNESGVVSQVSVALAASVFLGYGNFFLLTWAGVYA